ncbi:hypothetical protein M409DRAFT_20455 [Zasmidium cellare ATCC 36951]|uniref:Stress response RCI peptide n=1 Tax=Zasmidium cellare ATCC 36951 TaxID=1080233 RepID=A0A6A6CQ82_ZASCE|nr:uncharacterized protein M409DRAFT_20455 [Zasmidium cellare ATCC 36951]KAF2169231.1 hypothetical protein M409DRAFT_20455 [Zasmidium cellare ATCC 36951]
MRGPIDRFILLIVNFLFPPAAVYGLCGLGLDLALNCVFFVLAIIPSHIHGFYITCTYFHRRRKVKKGKYPGGEKMMIFSDHVTNGGASNEEVGNIRRKEQGLPPRSRSRNGGSRRHSREGRGEEMVQRRESDLHRRGTNSSRRSNGASPRRHDPEYAEHVARDGYGPYTQQLSPSRSRPQRRLEYTLNSPAGSQLSARSERRRELV